MTLQKFICGAILLLSAISASACLNEYDEELDALLSRPDVEHVKRVVVSIENRYKANPTHELANDLGAAYVVLGKYDEAISILRKAEESKPGQPKTAFNLGTALELAGKTDEALHWINVGLSRDPKDHQETEWLHAKILKAKLHLQQTPTWLSTNSVLGLSFGSSDTPKKPNESISNATGKRLTLKEIQTAVDYQLKERLKFVTPPDPIVGDLLFDWGNLSWLTGEGYPNAYYLAALDYKAPRTLLVERRLHEFESRKNLYFWINASIPIGLGLTLVIWWWRKRGRSAAHQA